MSGGLEGGRPPSVLWLIGMMGSGKTTIGSKVAAEVGVPFFDTDQMVIDMAGLSVQRLWIEHGEPGFRALERRAVENVPDSECVAAAGGGTVLHEVNRQRISRSEKVVWLKCNVTELSRRVPPESRPILEGDAKANLSRILEERTGLYGELATHVLNTDRLGVERAVSELVGIWNV